VVGAIADLKLAYPQIDASKRKELVRARRELLAQKP
jgi:hypothetical protein